MRTKFWIGYLLFVFAMLGGTYFVTSQTLEVPLVLSDSQMEQLSGSLLGWECTEMEACMNIPCNNNNMLKVQGYSGCWSCETAPNLTCYYEDKDKRGLPHCKTCAVYQYSQACETQYLIGYQVTSYRPCSSP